MDCKASQPKIVKDPRAELTIDNLINANYGYQNIILFLDPIMAIKTSS